MRALCFQSIENVSVENIPDPGIEEPTDVIVEVEVAGLCGSDLHPYFGREVGLDPGTVMGHEFVGTVVEVGGAVERVAIGDRVCSPFTTNCGECFYCRCGLSARCEKGQLFGWRQNGEGLHGGQSERVRVPLGDATLLGVSEEVDSELALLLGDNLTTGYFGASMCVEPESVGSDVIAVVGCGTVGLLAILSAQRMGATNIVAIDPNPARLSIAERLGASGFSEGGDAIDHVRSITSGRGADGVMEFVGLPAAQRLAYQLLRPGGRMSVIGCHCTPHFAFSPTEAYDKNLSFRTGRCNARSLMEQLVPMVADSPMDTSWCITHRFGIDDAAEAYDVFANRKEGCVKAVLYF